MQLWLIGHVVLKDVLLFGPGFGLVWNVPIGRIDDPDAASAAKPSRRCGHVDTTTATSTTRRRRAATRRTTTTSATACRGRLDVRYSRRRPEALHIGMAVGQPWHRTGRRRRRA